MHEILFHERLKGLLRYLAKNNSIQEDKNSPKQLRTEMEESENSTAIQNWNQNPWLEPLHNSRHQRLNSGSLRWMCPWGKLFYAYSRPEKKLTCQFPLSKFCSTRTGTVLINQFHLRYEPLRSFGTITSLSLITSFQPPLIAEPLDIECRRRRKLLKNVLPCKHIHSWQL